MSGSFSIGDFKGGSSTPRATAPVETPVPPAAAAEAAVVADAVKTPAERYNERLKDVGISKEEAAAIFDEVLTKGYYQETVSIRGRKAILRTRTYEDHIRALTAVETFSPRYQMSQEELHSRFNLAASLVEWNGTVYKKGGDSAAEFKATHEAVQRLPAPVYGILISELVKFDAKMFVVFSDGAADSF